MNDKGLGRKCGHDLIDRMRSNVKNVRITDVQAEIRTWNTPGIQVYIVSAANVKLKVKCVEI